MKIPNVATTPAMVKVKKLSSVSQGVFAVCFALVLAACSSGSGSNNDNNDGPPPAAAPFQELIDQGVTRYMGVYSPSTTAQVGDSIEYTFGVGEGPLCLYGEPYTMATRNSGSDDLLIFLQGGGACWFPNSGGLCAASSSAAGQLPIPINGLLSPDPSKSPLAGTSAVYVPYCDGGLHASDADYDSNDDGNIDLYHRGLHNLTASLDVAMGVFPAPSRVILAGVSGGAYGALFALPLVSQAYPGVPIDVLNDSGIGITRPDDPVFNQAVVEYWNIEDFFPASVPNVMPEGSPTTLLNWQLKQDTNIRMGMFSYAQDSTIGTFFLGLDPSVFEGLLRSTVADVETANEQRVRSFIADGGSHTFLGGDLSLSVEGVTLYDWVDAMINEPLENWESVSGAPIRDE
jgi:hypothetical protein